MPPAAGHLLFMKADACFKLVLRQSLLVRMVRCIKVLVVVVVPQRIREAEQRVAEAGARGRAVARDGDDVDVRDCVLGESPASGGLCPLLPFIKTSPKL